MKKLVKESLNEAIIQDGIKWNIDFDNLLDSNEHLEIYNAYGKDIKNHEYKGSAYFVDKRFEEIKDIKF